MGFQSNPPRPDESTGAGRRVDDRPEVVNPYASPQSDSPPPPPIKGSYLDHYQGWLLIGLLGSVFGASGLIGPLIADYSFVSPGEPVYAALLGVGLLSLVVWLLLNFLGRR